MRQLPHLTLLTTTVGLLLIALFATSGRAQTAPGDKPDPEPEGEEELVDPEAGGDDEEGRGKKDKDSDGEEEEEKPPTPREVVEGCDEIPGLFTLHQDPEEGKTFFTIRKRQLGREFIYFTHVVDGAPSLGHFRGGFGQEVIVEFRRHFGRLEVVRQNHAYYFDPENAIARAADANITEAVLASLEILAENKGKIVVDAGLFLTEALRPIKPPEGGDHGGGRIKLGSLSSEKTKFHALASYPENTAVTVDYVFDNSTPGWDVDYDEDITDPRYITTRLQHTLIAMPDEEGFEPRFEDARVGFFTTQVTDLTSSDVTPYRDLAHRWRLEKADPEAELSKPVEPITFWIENTTPRELRPIIRRAGLRWNEAFESAGFDGAIAIKVQPDDAEWDAGDIRYNVLRWTSSPDPPFGGYGPSFVNPRTGEIIGADIMLEYSFLANRLDMLRSYDPASDRFGEDDAAVDAGRAGRLGRSACDCCDLSRGLFHHNQFARVALIAGGRPEPEELERLMDESLTKLILHEIGHTIGLTHNFKASRLHPNKDINNSEVTEPLGLYASVMDYPAVNIAPPGQEQGQFYTTRPGPYDHWAVAFGYTPEFGSARGGPAKLAAHLARSTEPALAYGNDADDMRSPGSGIDPRAMIYDLTGDPIAFGRARLRTSRAAAARLSKDLPLDGSSHHELRTAYNILLRDQRGALETASRYVGGVYVDRALVGQAGAPEPFVPVPRKLQKEAMAFLTEAGFSPDALRPPADLAPFLQYQRRGFNFRHMGKGEDPKLHEAVLGAQTRPLDHILHPNTINRIINTTGYGNNYPLEEMLGDLTDAVFPQLAAGDKAGAAPEVDSYQENLQVEFTGRVLRLVDHGSLLPSARGHALFQVRRIARWAEPLAEARPHAAHLAYLIDQALEKD